MYFYKLEQDGEAVFATASDVMIPDPRYVQITREEYEEWTGEAYREEESPEEHSDMDLMAAAYLEGVRQA